MVKLVKERADVPIIAATIIFGLWVIAWGFNWYTKGELEIPQALNVIMPVAAGVLLGIKLPHKKEDEQK